MGTFSTTEMKSTFENITTYINGLNDALVTMTTACDSLNKLCTTLSSYQNKEIAGTRKISYGKEDAGILRTYTYEKCGYNMCTTVLPNYTEILEYELNDGVAVEINDILLELARDKEITDYVETKIKELSSSLTVEEDTNVIATIGMGITKVTEGVLTAGEQVVDGVNTGCVILFVRDESKKDEKIEKIKQDVVGDFFMNSMKQEHYRGLMIIVPLNMIVQQQIKSKRLEYV